MINAPAPPNGQPWLGHIPRQWTVEAMDAIRRAIASGQKRPLVQACTGSGKSVFLAEIAARTLARTPTAQVLITTPTQALVEQLYTTVRMRCPGNVGRVYANAWEPHNRITVVCHASLERLLAHRDTKPDGSFAVWLADEAHRLEGEDLRVAAEGIRAGVAVGLTATPFLADKRRGLGRWDEMVYAYSSHQAVQDGILVPWDCVRWDGEDDAADTDAICRDWVRDAQGPGIVSAVSIEDANQFADYLNDAAIPALAVHSRLPRKALYERIAALRNGSVRALVHVSLLSEGVDWPWLRWLVLRRKTASPVRLVQEVGRVLRCAPGKSRATIYDPHDCLGEVGLVHASKLEDTLASATKEGEDWTIPELEHLPGFAGVPPAVAVDRLSGWVTDTVAVLRSASLAPPPVYGEGPWRSKPASEKQRQTLGKMMWAAKFLPKDARKPFGWLLAHPRLRKGTASDALEIVFALASHKREPTGIRVPTWQLQGAWGVLADLLIEIDEDTWTPAVESMIRYGIRKNHRDAIRQLCQSRPKDAQLATLVQEAGV